MANLLGDFFHAERKAQLLTLGQLAERLGYHNVNKGVRRLACFERDGTIKPDLLVKVAEELDVDWNVVERIIEEERHEKLEEFERWVSEPVPMRLVVRLTAAFYCQKAVPQEIQTQQEAETWACEFAAKHRLRSCLVLNRRWSVWIDLYGVIEKRTEAQVDVPNEPFMQVGSRTFLMDFAEEQP